MDGVGATLYWVGYYIAFGLSLVGTVEPIGWPSKWSLKLKLLRILIVPFFSWITVGYIIGSFFLELIESKSQEHK